MNIHQLLEKYGVSEAKPSTIPSDVSIKLIKDDGVSKPVDQINYQLMFGSLHAICSYCNKIYIKIVGTYILVTVSFTHMCVIVHSVCVQCIGDENSTYISGYDGIFDHL